MRQFAPSAESRFSVRPLIFLGATVLMIIVGLLCMHTFSGSPAGHGSVAMGQHEAAMAEQAATPDDAYPHEGAFAAHDGMPTTGAAVSAKANAAAPGLHGGMLLICVLALFAGLLLLIGPALLRGVLALMPQRLTGASLTATSALPRPPSLEFLSISRT